MAEVLEPAQELILFVVQSLINEGSDYPQLRESFSKLRDP